MRSLRQSHRTGAVESSSSRAALCPRQGSGGAEVETHLSPEAPSVAKRLSFVFPAVLVLLADQLTKTAAVGYLGSGRYAEEVELIPGMLRLSVTRNTGGIFGILQSREGAGLVFFFLTTIVIGALVVWAWKSPTHPLLVGVIAGGGLGNLADRVFRVDGGRLFEGGVVDFIDLSFWPSFNLADSAISIGVLLLLLLGFRREPDERGNVQTWS